MSYLYIIRCENFHKIGIASDVQSRLASLRTGNPFQMEVVEFYEFENPSSVETSIHQAFAEYRVNGEWFRFENGELDKIRQICVLLNGKKSSEDVVVTNEDVENANIVSELTDGDGQGMTKEQLEAYVADGWRLEPKIYSNNRGERTFYVLRKEMKKDGKRHRPMIYVGAKLPDGYINGQ